MGRPRKLITEKDETIMAEPKIHNMIRTLNAGTPDPNAQLVEEIDVEVGMWLERGYRLFNTHFLGTEVWQGDASKKGIVVLYVLVKD